MSRIAFSFVSVVLSAALAQAAVIYAPVQYQYRDPVMAAPTFYYGGSNPQVFQLGALRQARFNMGPSLAYIGTSYATEGRYAFNMTRPGIAGTSPAVTCTDLLPPGVNAYPYGFSVSDARNAAYAKVPLYFRKADLIYSAIPTPDGHLIVPPDAPLPGTIEIKPYHAPTTQPATAPASPQPILIIPKRLLKQPLQSNPAPVALAK